MTAVYHDSRNFENLMVCAECKDELRKGNNCQAGQVSLNLSTVLSSLKHLVPIGTGFAAPGLTRFRCRQGLGSKTFMNMIKTMIAALCVLAWIQFPASAQKATSSASKQKASPTFSTEQVKEMVRRELGDKVKADSGGNPSFLAGDFNGDGYQDIAAIVSVEEGRSELKSMGVKFVSVDPYSATNGKEIDPSSVGQNCLGLVFFHGTQQALPEGKPSAKYLLYDCFSSIKLQPRGRSLRPSVGARGKRPVPRGDSVLLDMESGATTLVYWDGKSYRGFGMRPGD
jgi:hypothetical protein